jgi:hypothetical protein
MIHEKGLACSMQVNTTGKRSHLHRSFMASMMGSQPRMAFVVTAGQAQKPVSNRYVYVLGNVAVGNA